MPEKRSPLRSLGTGLIALVIMLVYAYGFEITQIDLSELRSEQRQTSLTRVARALARPDIFEFDQEEARVNQPVFVMPECPSPAELPQTPATTQAGPYITITPPCGPPGSIVRVEGFGFFPNASGPVAFVPGSDPENVVVLGSITARTDSEGHFIVDFELPERASEDVQFVRAVIRRNVGAPYFSQNAKVTFEKIIETVFLALLATTLGTVLAIPISFFAARNLMKSVRSPLASIALSVLGWPLGIVLGYLVVSRVSSFTAPLADEIGINLLAAAIALFVAWLAVRWAMPAEESGPPPLPLRLARLLIVSFAILLGFFGLFQFAGLAINTSTAVHPRLGAFGFLGTFLFQLGDILRVITPALGALAAGGALSSFLGRLGQRAAEKGSEAGVKILNFVLAAAAGATIFGLVGALVEWLYQIGRPEYTFWGPVLAGAALGVSVAAASKPKESLPIGMAIYYITRTILNTLRSVEAVIMAIVFVIAVSIGPFAGVLALGLHTIVSLAKLYSEQVESILPGPLEALEATGANRLQTIIYAVVPQIIPPYISYTMYRWDINVRMSTIIGIVGGGGIGFVLIQNINQGNYRAASAQMLAIAVVVIIMDYVSSVIRERYV